jgi:hypothetical protein
VPCSPGVLDIGSPSACKVVEALNPAASAASLASASLRGDETSQQQRCSSTNRKGGSGAKRQSFSGLLPQYRDESPADTQRVINGERERGQNEGL